jgi:acyl-CoA synthetase (AMP-forming)/AMP-acid ligase II
LIELLRRVATADPDRTAIITDDGARTYGALAEQAEAVAAGLASRGIARFATVTDDAAAVVALLAGASLAGREVCQYPPTDDPVPVQELAGRFDHDVIVTDRVALAGVAGRVAVDDLASATAGGRGAGPADPPAVRPLLVLTTGTTGAPRGVRHDWGRVLRGTDRIRPAAGQRWLLAYGLHQFAGLQILVHVLAAGATLVAPAERRPKDGLAALRRHEVSHASATPTWWRFLLAELQSEGRPAPALEQITLGGEAAPGPLLEQLAATFPSAHLSHVYAASEIGSTGSVRDGRSGLDVSILDRGDDADIAMRIVDGELWVRSRIGMLGYYGEDPVDPDGWRPSGDLVEVVGDRIEFRGRTTEVINVGGVKVSPLPIEDLVEAVPGVEIARVFGRPNKMTGAIVAVEAVAAPGSDPAIVTEAIRTACAELPAAARPRSIRIVDELATHGGKRTRRDTSAG